MAADQKKEGSSDRRRSVLHWLRARLGEPVDGAGLGIFRIVWGAIMIVDCVRMLPKTAGLYSADYFHFKYAWFPWVEPLPENWMMAGVVLIMIACAAAVTLGIRFRFAAIVFAALYAWLFLIDKSYYTNHYYLSVLLAALLCTTRADAAYSLANLGQKKKRPAPNASLVPMWNYILLRGQVIIVYFFGGIAKLNSDWLIGEPVRHWFAVKPDTDLKAPIAWFPEILQQEWFVWFICYGGLIFDLAVGFLLLNRRTFWPAVAMLFGFHFMNRAIFRIGLFPFMGLGMIAIFFRPDGPRRFFRKWGETFPALRSVHRSPLSLPKLRPNFATPATTAFVTGYLLIHCLLPLRWIAYGAQNPSWTEVGHFFAWRMMLRQKDAAVHFYFNPPEAERFMSQEGIPPRLGGSQRQRMERTPHLLMQYAHELDRIFRANEMPGVEIRVAAVVSLNGRPHQLMIDPSRDLARVSYGFFEVPDWIVPLEKNGRAGMRPESIQERRARIEKVFKERVEPVMREALNERP